MDRISIQVSGDKELVAKLKALPAAVARENLVSAVEPAAKLIESAIKANIHDQASREHDAGELRQSIEATVTQKTRSKVGISVGTDVYYGRFVEFGHAIVPSWGKARAYKGKSHVIGRVPPHPFMRPAFDDNVSAAVDIINVRLRQLLAAAAR